MQEDFLHFIWRTKSFDPKRLTTTTGDPITLIEAGIYNVNAGPDFLDARLKIGDTLWAGNVEMHLKTSDWLKHKHQDDKAYDNVILHVVMEEDKKVVRKTGDTIPCLVLKDHIPKKLVGNYKRLLFNENWISCQNHIHTVSSITKKSWLDSLLVERLEQKTKRIEELWHRNLQDWETTCYQLIAMAFGTKVNAAPFEILSRILPLQLLNRHKDSRFQTEALLFGQAGFLAQDFEDIYPNKLKKGVFVFKEQVFFKTNE